MQNPHRTIINSLVAMLLTVAILVTPLVAHGGYDHVRGIVVSVNNNVLTVKTSTANVDIKLDSKTQFTKDNQKAQISDLVPGVRVIVDVPQGKAKDAAAHSVQIGAAAAGKSAAKK